MSSDPSLNRLRVKRNEAMITLLGVPDVPGIAAAIFSAFAAKGIPITMIVQNAPDAGSTSITFTVRRSDMEAATAITRGMVESVGAEGIVTDERITRLSVLGGDTLEDTVGIAAAFFSVLAAERINVLAINSTGDVISCIVEETNGDRAAALLSQEFGLTVEMVD